MYVAMNRFRVQRGQETAFETVWRERESHLESVEGFKTFHMLRGASEETHTLYVSHSIWQDEDAFRGWTRSEAFRKAHAGAGDHRALYLGPPDFEGFTVVDGIR